MFPDGNVRAVDDISFAVKEGEIFSFLGPNGAGKTTTINIAATALEPTAGTARIFGHDVVKEKGEARKRIGICPQENVFYEALTIEENLLFYGRMYRKSRNELASVARDLINKVGLHEKRNALASKLSGGMKRRLNLIIGLVNDPDLIFLDEPTAGLDPQTRRLVWEYIKELKARGKTILLTTHYMDEADELSDHVAIIDNGKIIALDTPFTLKQRHSSGDIIELKFKDSENEAERTIKEIADELHFTDCGKTGDGDVFRIAMHGGLKQIGGVIGRLNDAGLSISDMAVKSNTLENVFISLTGKSLRE